MTQEYITIEEIIKLNKFRTQGEWKSFGNFVEIKDDECFSGDNIYSEWDAAFIAAAPRIATKAIELDRENKRLKAALDALCVNIELAPLTNETLFRRLG